MSGSQKESAESWRQKYSKEYQETESSVISGSVTEDNLSWKHLLEKKDPFTIQRVFSLTDFPRAPKRSRECFCLYDKMRTIPRHKPILSHNFQGETQEGYDLAKVDILIVIKTPFQRSMLQKFGPNGVCCDCTHGTNGYDFLLTTELVTDECGNGLPAALCISNHEDFTTMCTFLREVNKNTGTIYRSLFMGLAPQSPPPPTHSTIHDWE